MVCDGTWRVTALALRGWVFERALARAIQTACHQRTQRTLAMAQTQRTARI